MSAQLTLILGGARSGKSSYAEKLAAELSPRVLYVATAEAGDAEMVQRIQAHRLARPAGWQTLEAPTGVAAALKAHRPEVILLDCLTLLVSNLILALEAEPPAEVEAAVLAEVEALIAVRAELAAPMIIVSNEVGLGLVPPYPLGRVYRDALGRANARLAAAADRVLLMVAGLPLALKG